MNKEITLVIMAAGIGSRFGERIKQLEPVGPDGELIIDYSVFDAVRAGFNHVVFIIRKDIEVLVKEKIGDRLSKHVKVSYAFQEKNDIPVKGELAPLRAKPWGTGQAVLAAKDIVKGPFAVINADDFYGAEAYKTIAEYLRNADECGVIPEYAMCGFKITNTLSENGTVTRGICTVNDGCLIGLEETKEIKRDADGVIKGVYNGETKIIAENAAASMNMWCFTEGFMTMLSRQFIRFLSNLDENSVNNGEFLVPIEIDKLIKSGECTVKVLTTDSKWFGMTYAEDVAEVKKSLAEYGEKGTYPAPLWE